MSTPTEREPDRQPGREAGRAVPQPQGAPQHGEPARPHPQPPDVPERHVKDSAPPAPQAAPQHGETSPEPKEEQEQPAPQGAPAPQPGRDAPLYGLLAEFPDGDALLAATRAARAHGYARVEAYAPFAVEGLEEAVGMRSNRIPLITLLGGVAGGAATYFLQWYAAVVDYPINVGGRPLHSWPAFIPATFEITILGAALAAAVGMLALNGLPRLHHPLFEVEEFELASRNRFFLCLPARDPAFDRTRSSGFLRSLDPLLVREVPA
ncbi:DUF3341 domain-containing protein [Massilia forsythiae]|uniref:DUF3341 domain-containing protein n=1 Tax=Massilia forsythiae TaxID=2728020 RepID=A0A7Z2VZA7_9BURK|nr:DUF3341 domain-containing protein [Massilia forsythiae]QJE01860.1 DUF3341 domain-containing protein [Massilia forsythiae]